jgi:hypothetical protein
MAAAACRLAEACRCLCCSSPRAPRPGPPASPPTQPMRDDDARALTALLAPTGPLFAAMRAADADRLIHFLFPPERLPAHTQVGGGPQSGLRGGRVQGRQKQGRRPARRKQRSRSGLGRVVKRASGRAPRPLPPQELLQSAGGRAELDRWPQYRGRLRTDGAGRCQVRAGPFGGSSGFRSWHRHPRRMEASPRALPALHPDLSPNPTTTPPLPTPQRSCSTCTSTLCFGQPSTCCAARAARTARGGCRARVCGGCGPGR